MVAPAFSKSDFIDSEAFFDSLSMKKTAASNLSETKLIVQINYRQRLFPVPANIKTPSETGILSGIYSGGGSTKQSAIIPRI